LKTTPQPSEPSTTESSKLAKEVLHPICKVSTYGVDAGKIRSIPLDVKHGQRVRGHLKEVDRQPFDWYLADEKNMILFENGDRDAFTSIDADYDQNAYRVSRKIPYPGRWYLILDAYGKQYDREVSVDLEPVPA
jgi:hypothetical protein